LDGLPLVSVYLPGPSSEASGSPQHEETSLK